MTEALADIDRIDLKILNVLQQDGRISNIKLAEAVALSPTAVLARVHRLTRDGYILGYEARLNPLKLGAGMMVWAAASRPGWAVAMPAMQRVGRSATSDASTTARSCGKAGRVMIQPT